MPHRHARPPERELDLYVLYVGSTRPALGPLGLREHSIPIVCRPMAGRSFTVGTKTVAIPGCCAFQETMEHRPNGRRQRVCDGQVEPHDAGQRL